LIPKVRFFFTNIICEKCGNGHKKTRCIFQSRIKTTIQIKQVSNLHNVPSTWSNILKMTFCQPFEKTKNMWVVGILSFMSTSLFIKSIPIKTMITEIKAPKIFIHCTMYVHLTKTLAINHSQPKLKSLKECRDWIKILKYYFNIKKIL